LVIKDRFRVNPVRNIVRIKAIADNGSVGHGLNGSTYLDRSCDDPRWLDQVVNGSQKVIHCELWLGFSRASVKV